MAGPTTGSASSDAGALDSAREQAKDKAQEVTGQARSQLRDQVDQRSTQYGRQITSQASDLRSVGDQLREQGKEGPAKIADQAAQRVERAGSWLEQSDADQILDDVEDFARRNPWAVAAGGLALGFMASRFLKASSTNRYETRSSAGQIPRRTSEPRFSRTTGPGSGQYEATAGTTRTGTAGTGVTPPPSTVPPMPSGTTPSAPTRNPGGGV